MTPLEDTLMGLANDSFALMDDTKTAFTIGEHLVMAERLLNLYKRMASNQARWAADNDIDFTGEGSLSVVRHAVEMHTALAVARASL